MPPLRFKRPKKITVLGSRARGCALCHLMADNVKSQPQYFDNQVTMFVMEELINGKRLSHIINETHENPVSLPGYKLPDNVVAVGNLEKAVREADILMFDLPFEVIKLLCVKLYGKLKPTAFAITLAEGMKWSDDGGIDRNAYIIDKKLRVETTVISGAIDPLDMFKEIEYFELTISCKDIRSADIFRVLLTTRCMHTTIIDDKNTMECCGALKNVLSLPKAFGLNLSHPQMATLIRIGIIEMMKFVDIFFPNGKLVTFFESCGIASLFVICYLRSDVKMIEKYLSLSSDEKEEIPIWRKPVGVVIAQNVNHIIYYKEQSEQFPLITTICKIAAGEDKPEKLLECFRNYPEEVWVPKRVAYQ